MVAPAASGTSCSSPRVVTPWGDPPVFSIPLQSGDTSYPRADFSLVCPGVLSSDSSQQRSRRAVCAGGRLWLHCARQCCPKRVMFLLLSFFHCNASRCFRKKRLIIYHHNKDFLAEEKPINVLLSIGTRVLLRVFIFSNYSQMTPIVSVCSWVLGCKC